MANTYTTYYNILKPEVGGDTNAWGTHINADLDIVDATLHSISTVASAALPKAGGTMTGSLVLPSNGLTVGTNQLVVSSGNVSASGSASFGGTLAVTGAVTLSSSLNVSSGQLSVSGGNVSMSGALAVTSAITGSSITTSGTGTFGGLNVNSSQFSVGGGSVTSNGPVTINYSSEGALTLNSGGNINAIKIMNGSSMVCSIGGNPTYPFLYSKSIGVQILYADTSGNFTATGNITAYSDAKLKENVKTITDAIGIVRALRGVRYDRIDTGEAGIGVIAQEMQKIVPEVVKEVDGTLTVAYGNLVGVLIEAIKELSDRVRKLENA